MFEVELKSLPSQAAIDKIRNNPGRFHLNSTETQLNHYFSGELKISLEVGVEDIASRLGDFLSAVDFVKLFNFLVRAGGRPDAKQSVRTRHTSFLSPDKSLLIIKVSINDTTSENGTIREEVEVEVDLSLDKLDAILLAEGLTVKSKWRRHRDTYDFEGVTLCLDFNAGYGNLLEVELLVHSKKHVFAAKERLHEVLNFLGCKELDSDHLEKMFSEYNQNWALFYDSGKTFSDFPEYKHLVEV